MAVTSDKARKDTLDKDLDKFVTVEEAAGVLSRGLVAPGLALLFIAFAGLAASIVASGEAGVFTIVAAAAIGGYMALTIGANDVTNNVSAAVGAKALTIGSALIIAAIFETAGALIAGGDVVATISKGIVSPDAIPTPNDFVWLMMAALLSSALWVHLATWIGAPVSTTHSIVGGVLGAGVASAGINAVDWTVMGGIAASWIISPLAGGVIAAFFLYLIKSLVIYRDDKIEAARVWVPVFVAIMGGAFATYLCTKGLSRVIHLTPAWLLTIAVASTALSWILSHRLVAWQSKGLENRNQSLRKLFRIPLVISAALLSFAHGANDVANAVGPLAAIVSTARSGSVEAAVGIPLWVMFIGGAGISLGLLLFGPRLVQMVGEQITKLNPMRGFCVALSAALTVLVASALGLPVSSTHIAVGAVFGVGFFREWYTARSPRRRAYLARKAERHRAQSGALSTQEDGDEEAEPIEELPVAEIARRRLVRRAHVTTIVTAWLTTVPLAAALAAAIYWILSWIG